MILRKLITIILPLTLATVRAGSQAATQAATTGAIEATLATSGVLSNEVELINSHSGGSTMHELAGQQPASSPPFYRHSMTASVIITLAYSIVFLVGIVGNSFVVAIVCKSPRMRTVTNYFIVNLALADILVLVFCLPATLVSNLFTRKYEPETRRSLFVVQHYSL